MKLLTLITILLISIPSFAKRKDKVDPKCSLRKSMEPWCYHKREKAELNVALLYYGNFWKLEDLDRIEPILKERFHKATNKKISVNILVKKVLPYMTTMPKDYKYKSITDPARLQRIFYYETVNARVMTEVYEQYKKTETGEMLDKLDAVLAITGAQFEGLGFASGRVSVTEQPREIAFGLPDGGRVDVVSDYQIVDELIHELGHNMFMGHASTQCQKAGMDYKDKLACCEQSPAKNDVMSYCRNRSAVDEKFMHGFEACMQGMIEDLVIPAMLKGKQWNVKGRVKCE